MKQVMCVVSKTPYESAHSLELLEAAMVGAVFDFQVSLLFRADGIWSLVHGQNGQPIGKRTLSNVLLAMPTYEVERIYACAEAVRSAGLDLSHCELDVVLVEPNEQAQLLASQHAVIGAAS